MEIKAQGFAIMTDLTQEQITKIGVISIEGIDPSVVGKKFYPEKQDGECTPERSIGAIAWDTHKDELLKYFKKLGKQAYYETTNSLSSMYFYIRDLSNERPITWMHFYEEDRETMTRESRISISDALAILKAQWCITHEDAIFSNLAKH